MEDEGLDCDAMSHELMPDEPAMKDDDAAVATALILAAAAIEELAEP